MNSEKKIDIKKTYLIFFLGAIVGWIYEVILFYRGGHGFVNRGFLYGPYLPVYGFGCLIIYFLLVNISKKKIKVWKINIMPIIIFILVVVFTTTLEYITSLFCDYILHVELWNYSNWKINFQERIALIPSLRFGLLGILFIYVVNPIVDIVYSKLNNTNKIIIFSILLLIIIIDLTITITLKYIL